MATFIPDRPETPVRDVPYFEDSQEHDVPGRGTHKTVAQLKEEIVVVLARLGGAGARFIPGTFPGKPPRIGFLIVFTVAGAEGLTIEGRIQCAALPFRLNDTAKKRDRALAQALYVLRDKLQAMVHAYIYEPDSLPLVPYLVGDGGQTVTEAIRALRALPFGDEGTQRLESGEELRPA